MTLRELFKEIADAIRSVDGTVEPIQALQFPERIRSLSGRVSSAALRAAIAEATGKRDAAKEAGAEDYDFGTSVWPKAAIDALSAAIAEATATLNALGDTVQTQAELNAAEEKLRAAISAFDAEVETVAADTSGLTSEEERYTALKADVSTSDDGRDITFGSKWVTPAEQTAADTALQTARSAVEAAVKQSQIDAAVATLKSAIDTYSAAIKTAAKNTSALEAAISAANSAKEGVLTSDGDGSELPAGSNYVTSAEMEALTNALNTAWWAKENATTQAAIDSATSALTSATETFRGQIKQNLPDVPASEAELEAMSWSDIAQLSADCAENGTDKYTKLLGWCKNVSVSGVGTVKARIIGLQHDTFTEGGKTGFTFQLTDGLSVLAPANFQMNTSNTNSGGWAASYMRSTNLPKLKAALPADLQGLIKKTVKKSSTASSGTAVSDTDDDLFLLSLVEAIGTTKTSYTDNPIASSNYLYNEGTQYEYYKQYDTGKTTAFNAHIIKNAGGSASYWWLRSMVLSNSARFYNVHTSGGWDDRNASNSYLPAAGFNL